MAYTVKKLSAISGVTVRTLHFYEEAGLLKPAYYGSNGYRYYEEKELLRLQQILFFKELGFTLKQIQKVLGKSDFNLIAALLSHRQVLNQKWIHTGNLLKTIDKTIQHLKGKKKVNEKEFFEGFSLVKKARRQTAYFAEEEIVLNSIKRNMTETTDEDERRQIAKEANLIYSRITDCLEKGMDPSSKTVQSLIKQHWEFASCYHDLSNESYKALATLYVEHPQYRKQLDPIHPDLAPFMAKAMRLYADRWKE